MQSTNEKQDLKNKVNELNKQVRESRSRLTQLNDQKKEQIKQKQTFSKQIVELINSNKKLREERDKLTNEVKEVKEKRKKLNQEITKKIEEVKKLNTENSKVTQKQGVRENPSMIKKQIEVLEYKIETEGLKFEKEKQLTQTIKDLKKKLVQSQEVSGVWGKAHEVSKEINKLKKEADAFHKEIQTKADESQKKHELIIGNNKKIDALKIEEKKFNKVLDDKSGEIEEVNKELGTVLKQASGEGLKLQEKRKHERQKKEKTQKNSLNALKQAVEEKLAKGQKLTTEDLLVLQQE